MSEFNQATSCISTANRPLEILETSERIGQGTIDLGV